MDQPHGPIFWRPVKTQVYLIPKNPQLYSLGADSDSHFEHGVEFPELLSADTALVRKRKALQAIQKLYSPVAEATRDTAYHYPSGCIPQSEWKDVAGYPTTLPGMSIRACLLPPS